jgi:3-oxoacyl-[acyl-carrier protein] reductase
LDDFSAFQGQTTMKLTGKAALVTGGGRGIGRAIALALAAEGADVAVLGRTQSEIEAVAAEIQTLGRRAAAEVCDVTDRAAVERAIASAVEQLGRLDILVNNAGGGTERTRIGDDDPDHWVQAIEVNLHGTYFCTRAALPHLKTAGGGKIINVGSGMGHQPRKGNSSYNAAKAGVWMLTRCLAMELWEHGIEVNELIPGPVYTELTSDVFPPGGPHPSIEGERVKLPDDVVPLALFLATHAPGGPTGQTFSLARRPI